MLTARGRTVPGRMVSIGAAVLAAAGIAACGSSSSSSGSGSGTSASSNPQTLLRQTFAADHHITSGVIDASIVVDPKGSAEISTPLSVSLSGPFQSRGAGKSPESALTVKLSGLGHTAAFGVTTTAAGAYMSLEGQSYQLPASVFDKLGSKSSTGTSSGGAPGLSSFGIDPEDWVKDPQIVGTAIVDGVTTEHLRAAVNLPAFVQSLNKVLAKERSTLGSTASSTPSHITSAMAQKITALIKNPTVDLWTGKSDSTLRRIVVSATVPVSGTISTRLGGLTSASFQLTFNYSHLGETQSISAPSDPQSFAALETKLQSIGAQLESTLGGGLTGTTSSGTSGTSGTSSSGQVSKYAKCINGAGGDVAKMQRCAKDLQTGG